MWKDSRRRWRCATAVSQLCWMFFLKIIDDQDQELEASEARLSLAYSRFRCSGGPGPHRSRRHNRRRAAGFRQRPNLFPRLKTSARRRPSRAIAAASFADVFEDAYNYMKSGQLMRQVDQQDQSASTSTTWCQRQPFRRASTNSFSTTCKVRAMPASSTPRAP